ncbi:MAG: UDP-3-O-(3-hydroxymyristoyl)glucosamine N-acyltransferase [bacterium JZ-2024 1]
MIRLSELAGMLDAELVGEDGEIEGVCSLTFPQPGRLVFAESSHEYGVAIASPARAVLTSFRPAEIPSKPVIIAKDFRAAFAKCLQVLGRRSVPGWITHPDQVFRRHVSEGATVAKTARIGPAVVIEEGAYVGERTIIYPFCYIGVNAHIGDDCILYPGVTIMDGVRIGEGAILQPGAIVGSEGFGFYREKSSGVPQKIPQIGTCEIGERVEIGANTCVDRATIDRTRIGEDTKLDNLVQVAHNVVIGRGTLVAAQVGISGSVAIGERVTIGGQAAFNDHVSVGGESTIAGRAAVFSSLPPRSFVSGYPALPHREALRILAVYARLPDLLDRIRRIERAIGLQDVADRK